MNEFYHFTFAYLFALRHNMQQITSRTTKKRQTVDMLQKATCRGVLGSYQNSVVGFKVGTSTPTTVGRYCVQKADSVCL